MEIKNTPMGSVTDYTNEIFAIWISQEGNYMMPLLYEVCIASWQIMNPNMKVVIYASNPEIKFNLLSRDTTEVRIIEEEFPGLLQTAQNLMSDVPYGMKFAHISDYVRYYILSKLGGIYVDCDLCCINSIENMIEKHRQDQQPIILAYEDSMRICNAFLANLGDTGYAYYEQIVKMYDENYIKTSYTFNSIKFPKLLANKFHTSVDILPFKHGMFYPNWEKNENGDLSLLTQDTCPLESFGVHFYNTDPKWKEIRDIIEHNLYTDDQNWWILEHLNCVINKYIQLMKNSSTRDITKDKILVDNLTRLYGEDYLKQFGG